MASELEQRLEEFIKMKEQLQNAQQQASIASDRLLHHCIETKESCFLKLDDAAIRRYLGMRSR